MATFKRGSNNVLHVTNGRKTLRLPFGMDVYADKSDDISIHITYKEQANKDRKAAPIKIDWRTITTPSAKTRVNMVYELQKVFRVASDYGDSTRYVYYFDELPDPYHKDVRIGDVWVDEETLEEYRLIEVEEGFRAWVETTSPEIVGGTPSEGGETAASPKAIKLAIL